MKLLHQANLKPILLKSLAAAAALIGLTGSVQAQPPITNGLILRLDASQITGTSDGAQLGTWADTSGTGNNAVRQSTSSTGFPKYIASGLNSQPVVRFNSSTANTGDYFKFPRISTIRSVFWVLKDSGPGDQFLLGDDTSYDFHRGIDSDNGKIWDSRFVSPNITSGTTKLMGNVVTGTTTALPTGSFQLLSVVTGANVQASQLCQDRTYHGSWQGDIAEVLVYNRALSSSEESIVGGYLAAKYALTTAYPAPALATAINVNFAGGPNPGNAWMNGYSSSDSSAAGTASRVAPLAYAGTSWNDFTGSGANSTNLTNSVGVATGIGLTTTMQNGPWNDWSALGGNRMLVSGLISSYSTYTKTLAFTGLNPARAYNLAIACLHNSGSPTSTFRVGSVEKALTYSGVSTWTEGKTHVLFTSLVPTASGTLDVDAKSTGELVLNGLQLVDATPQSDIVSFTFPSAGNATISGTNISITVPYGTNVSALAPTFSLSYGATCNKVSGSSQNFTNPVHYLVYSSNGSVKDYTVTVNRNAIPDPVFTLTAPTTWNGRTTITVQPNITNAAQITAAGGTVQGYKWNVSGIATSRSISGNVMTLTRAQGNGPLVISLALNTGGTVVTRTAVITVQQPTSDAWVVRTPDVGEKPVDGQFFARDPSGYGTIFYRGTETGSPTSVYLKVFRTDTGTDVQYGATQSQSLVGGTYSFSAPILGGLYKYKVVYGKITGGIDTPVATVSNLICGDAYILQGQSNTLAELPNNGTPPEENYYTSDWIRSYGTANTEHALSSNSGGWGVALRTRKWRTDLHGRYQIGAWGINMARILLQTYNMPICVINGAVGGTRIDQHQRDDSNQANIATIYGRLLSRMKDARLTHGVRAVLWHQGENDQGSTGPYSPVLNYNFYKENFISMTADWKENYPNLKNYYIFQILPNACGGDPGQDELREIQRNLPSLYSNMRIMSSLGAEWGDKCHYALAGYERFADQITPLVEQDFYGRSTSQIYSAPNLQKAYFTSATRTEIALQFDQTVAWNPGAPGLFFLDGIANRVASGSASGKIIKLQLTAASSASTINYVMGSSPWDRVNVIYGGNGVAALTFHKVPITLPAAMAFTSWTGNMSLPTADATASADPDNDGVPNALECVLGGEPNPNSADSNSAELLPTISPNSGDLVFRFKRKDASEGMVDLTFEWSSDLSFAISNTVTIGATSSNTNGGVIVDIMEDTPDEATDDIVITVPATEAVGGKLFGRLNATIR